MKISMKKLNVSSGKSGKKADKKKEPKVKFADMVVELKAFLRSDRMKYLRLRMTEQRPDNFMIYQGSYKAHAYIRPVRCHFVRMSLLRAIKKHGTSKLQRYFVGYSIATGGR